MFLDKSCKKIVNFMRDTQPNMNDGLFTGDYIAEQCSIEHKHCSVFLEHLAEMQLVKIHTVPFPSTPDGKAIWGYSLMPKGIAFDEYQRNEFITLILQSILLPIIVALITSLLVA